MFQPSTTTAAGGLEHARRLPWTIEHVSYMRMTSRGIGDVRRVLGQPKSWIEQTFPKPAPPLPDARGDALIGFVCSRVTQWESQVETEAAEYRDRPLGAAMVRYALDIR